MNPTQPATSVTHLLDRAFSRRAALGLGAGAAGLVALSACSSGSGSGSATTGAAGSGAASSAAAPTTAAAPAATNFNFVSWGITEDATKPVLQAAVDAFAAAKAITVTTSGYPYNDYLNQVLLQINGGQFQGVAQLDIAWLPTLAATGKLADLGAYTQGIDYTSSALLVGQSGGVQYGLPWTTAAIGLIAHQGNLDAAGVTSLPTTIDEFEAALTKLKAIDGLIPYAASTKVAQLKDVQAWMLTFGSPLFKDGQCTIGDDESIAAMTWYKQLYDAGLIAPDVDRSGARSLFSQGTVGFYDDAPAGKPGVIKSSPDADLAAKMVPLPRPVLKAGDTPQAQAWGHLLVVVAGEGQDTASEFAQWMTGDAEQTVSYFKSLALPPTTETALQDAAVTSDTFTSQFTERVTKTSTPSPFWQFTNYAQMDSAVADQVQAALIGTASPADAMKAAGDAVNELIG
jgi:multiple sugar transport system substrate-binding protein